MFMFTSGLLHGQIPKIKKNSISSPMFSTQSRLSTAFRLRITEVTEGLPQITKFHVGVCISKGSPWRSSTARGVPDKHDWRPPRRPRASGTAFAGVYLTSAPEEVPCVHMADTVVRLGAVMQSSRLPVPITGLFH